jgi:hypothetical protein
VRRTGVSVRAFDHPGGTIHIAQRGEFELKLSDDDITHQ